MIVRAALIAIILAAGILASFGLARLGEPQSAWLWCQIGQTFCR